MAEVMSEPVALRGAVRPRDRYPTAEVACVHAPALGDYAYTAGGYRVACYRRTPDEALVQLLDSRTARVVESPFPTVAAAEAEFARLRDLLTRRDWVQRADPLLGAVLPPEFVPALRPGEPQALLVAADWQE